MGSGGCLRGRRGQHLEQFVQPGDASGDLHHLMRILAGAEVAETTLALVADELGEVVDGAAGRGRRLEVDEQARQPAAQAGEIISQ